MPFFYFVYRIKTALSQSCDGKKLYRHHPEKAVS